MDIRELHSGSATPPDPARGKPRVERSDAQPGSNDGSLDKVTMSDRAQACNEVRHAVLASPEVRTNRVEEVRQRLGNGEISPEPRRIAGSLLASGLL